MKKCIVTLLVLGMIVPLMAQENAPKDWFLRAPADGYPGISAQSFYSRLPQGTEGQTVVVAVIDSGVDYEHEDLDDVMWVNAGEIPGNGIDDDNNGYVDDIHGWNFIGNAKGENIGYDNLEVTRLYAKYRAYFEGKEVSALKKKDREKYDLYQKTKEEVESKREGISERFGYYSMIYDLFQQIDALIENSPVTADDLKNLETDDARLKSVGTAIAGQVEAGATFEAQFERVTGAYEYLDGQYSYNFNPDFEPRALVGDNYSDKNERYYGNNDVRGPDSRHGTHVAGIIAAERNNDIGMDGVASNVRIMSIRTVPDGDERDKDVANAIRYAVDNGASIINMSFGKGYSPYKQVVDDAVKYARKNDVLLVHAAGNDGKENTDGNNFPHDKYEKKGLFGPKSADNWLEVGALNYEMGKNLPAPFSNYSKNKVDVFAPGMAIYATVPNNKYEYLQGTSMAAPVVAGIAAVLRSYFPDLTAQQVKEAIMTGMDQKSDESVVKPGSGEEVLFSELSVTGGIVNLEKAFETALKMEGKKRKAGSRALNSLPKKQVQP